MKNKTIYLIGGFGNNLFQLNKAQQLIDDGYSVCINTCFLRSSVITKVLGWSVHSTELTQQVLENYIVNDRTRLKDLIAIITLFIKKKIGIYDSQDFNGHTENSTLVGYWQKGVKLNRNFLNVLRKSLSTTSLVYKPLTVVHARLGDFPDSLRLHIDYYVSAIKFLNVNEVHLITDTPSFRENLIKRLRLAGVKTEINISESSSARDDFELISSANTVVMSNSTFCYWATQLKPVKNVIYPKNRSPELIWDLPLNNQAITSYKGYL